MQVGNRSTTFCHPAAQPASSYPASPPLTATEGADLSSLFTAALMSLAVRPWISFTNSPTGLLRRQTRTSGVEVRLDGRVQLASF